MMKFHVPNNVSSYIKCGSESACKEKDMVAGFAAWYSCPVCAYRICSGCAAVDVPDFVDNKNKFSVENLLTKQFAQFGTEGKKPPTMKETQGGHSPLPGQVC